MKTENFLKSLLNLDTVKKETVKEKKVKLVKVKNFTTYQEIRGENQKGFGISLFQKRDVFNNKSYLFEYVYQKQDITNKLKSDIILSIQNGEIKEKGEIDNIINILKIENLIEKKQEKEGLVAIELENQLNLYIENLDGKETSNINFFFLLSNALKHLKYQEEKKSDKYDDINTNFFGIDESKNKIDIVKESYNNKFIIEKLSELENFKTVKIYFENLEEEKIKFMENQKEKKEEIKNLVKYLENTGKNEKEILETEMETLEKIDTLKDEIRENERKRKSEITMESKKIKDIILKWNIEIYK